MGKKSDLSEFDRGLVVGARRAGLSVSAAANLLGFSRTTVSRVFREWSERRVVASARQACGRKCLVDDCGQRRLDHLIQGDREATVAQLTARYNHGQQRTISQRTTRRTLKRLGYSKTPLSTPPKTNSDHGRDAEGLASTDPTQEPPRPEPPKANSDPGQGAEGQGPARTDLVQEPPRPELPKANSDQGRDTEGPASTGPVQELPRTQGQARTDPTQDPERTEPPGPADQKRPDRGWQV